MADPWKKLNGTEKSLVRALLEEYREKKYLVRQFLDQIRSTIVENDKLRPFVHSTKERVKEPEHLRIKLARKCLESKKAGVSFSITTRNLFTQVTDLAGFRILHLHTHQMREMHPLIIEAFKTANLPLNEKPFARTWDDEYREFYKALGLTTQKSERMYTSVHYVLKSGSRVAVTGELQVRTLAEELWGEVDHAINYPRASNSRSCREQILVLARVTSGCTRLVDSIFDAHRNHEHSTTKRNRSKI